MNTPSTTPIAPAGFGLAGKSVLIVGASRGIGEAIARAFAAQGSRVMLGARDQAALQRLAAELDPSGKRVLPVYLDVGDAASVQAAVAATEASFGRLDIAVNNAGIQNIRVDENGVRTSRQDFTDTPDEAFDQLIHVNLRGVFIAMKHELRAMLRSGGGAIVNMASIGAVVGFARIAPYVASKHGVIGLTRTAALEYAERGIRVNALVPGTVLTEMLKAGPLSTPELAAQIVGNIPMKRVASVEEIASAVLWMSSDLASYLTGAAIPVDGGYTAA
jgi:NAD(P)-dependent dehydrogenase (short-subunit alcohol dehydrogenase family)